MASKEELLVEELSNLDLNQRAVGSLSRD